MKILYYLFFALVFCFSNAQTYLPMLEENNTWSVDFFYNPFVGGPTDIITDQITVAGNTIIGSHTYKSVYINGDEGSCLVREENGIVYRYDVANSQDEIWYDFTLDVGDTFVFPYLMVESYCASLGGYNGFSTEMTVVGVTTEVIANETRKVIEFDYYSESGYTCFWIEGIGSTLGFDPVGDVIDIGYAYLVCYTKNGNTYFFNNATSCDNTTLGIADFSSEEIILYPNPVTNKSILQLPTNLSVDLIKIYDINGQLINEETVTKDYFSIEMMAFRSGLYFYQAFSNSNHLKTGQFIVK